jgi:hypothetical protein
VLLPAVLLPAVLLPAEVPLAEVPLAEVPLAEVPLAEAGRVHEFAAQHDPVGQPGLPATLLMARRQRVHVREIDHRLSLPEPAGRTTAPGRHAIIDRVRVRREGDTRHGGW